jgi:hypothetical protein
MDVTLDSTTDVLLLEVITKNFSPEEIAAFVSGIVKSLRGFCEAKRLEPLIALDLRRAVKLLADPVGLEVLVVAGFVSAAAQLILSVPSEALIAPAASAEITTLVFMCLDAMVDGRKAVEKLRVLQPLLVDDVQNLLLRLFRMCASRQHYPIMPHCLRLMDTMYNVSSSARRVAMDKDIMSTLSKLQESSSKGSIPKEVIDGVMTLLITITQWLPKFKKTTTAREKRMYYGGSSSPGARSGVTFADIGAPEADDIDRPLRSKDSSPGGGKDLPVLHMDGAFNPADLSRGDSPYLRPATTKLPTGRSSLSPKPRPVTSFAAPKSPVSPVNKR